MGQIEYYRKPPMESLRRDVVGLRQGVFKTSSLEQWSEDMYYTIYPLLLFLEERKRKLEVS